MQQYLGYLHNQILELKELLRSSSQPTSDNSNFVISIADEGDDYRICGNPYCPCPHHKPGPTKPAPPPPPPPPPPAYGGYGGPAGYYGDEGSSNYYYE